MTAEALTNSFAILEERVPVALTVIEGAQSVPAESEKTAQPEGVNTQQRAVLQAVYGSQHKGNIQRLSLPEAIGLLNQAARVYLGSLPDTQRAAALEKLDIIGDYTRGLRNEEVAAKHGRSYSAVIQMKHAMYTAMRRALVFETKTGRYIDTPTSVVTAKIAPAQEKVAMCVEDGQGEWQERSLCHYLNPDLFDGTVEDRGSINFAKYVCSLCTVKDECLQAAVGQSKIVGIRAGLSGGELKKKIKTLK